MLAFRYSKLEAALRDLWRLRQANRDAMRFFMTPDHPEFVQRWAAVTDEVTEYASRISPWWTGTLSSAHRSALFVDDETITGSGFIDPSVINPLTQDYPAQYGIKVHRRKPWMATAVSHMTDYVTRTLSEMTGIVVNGIYRGVT